MALARRRGPILVGTVAAVTTPDPAVARYILALPALVFAAAASHVDRIGRGRRGVHWAAASVAAGQIAYAWPGLTGEGPPLLAYPAMTVGERALAVGASGRPTALAQARRRVGLGETFAFDRSFDLPYLAWESDLRYRAAWMADGLADETAGAFVDRENVRVIAASRGGPVAEWLEAHPDRFVELFACQAMPCTVYARR